MIRTIAAVVLAAGITALVYFDDQVAGEIKKNARYTRLFITATGVAWFLLPLMVKQLLGSQVNMMNSIGGNSGLMQQRFDIGPAPF